MLRVDHRLGFTVAEGGRHRQGRTGNALIGFADGTYLELLALNLPSLLTLVRVPHRARLLWVLSAARPPVERRFLAHARGGEGLLDFGLLTADLPGTVRRARASGLRVTDPAAGRRQRADGEEIFWDFVLPASTELPFLLADRTPRARRAPAPSICQHANGAAGIARLTVATRDVKRIARDFRCLPGTDPAEPPWASADLSLDGGEVGMAGPNDSSEVARHVICWTRTWPTEPGSLSADTDAFWQVDVTPRHLPRCDPDKLSSKALFSRARACGTKPAAPAHARGRSRRAPRTQGFGGSDAFGQTRTSHRSHTRQR